MSSIRSKILLAFAALSSALLVMTLFSWADLRFVEQQVHAARLIDGLREQTQEMRRHEKNALLYHQAHELPAAQGLALRQIETLAALNPSGTAGPPELSRADTHNSLAALRLDLQTYGALMQGLSSTMADPQTSATTAAAEPLRQVGQRLSTRTDQLATQANSQLTAALRASQQALLLAALTVLLFTAGIAIVLVRVVVQPLRNLERQLKPLAQGKFGQLPAVSNDREMLSLTQALSRMFDELESRRRQLLQAEKLASLGVLAAGVAHELNNPLGNVSAAAQILREELPGLSPAHAQWLGQIDAEVLRAQGIVQRLLDYAQHRPHAPTLALVNLQDTVQSAITLLRSRFAAASSIDVDIAPALGVVADRQRLQQVFINLIGNALGSIAPSAVPQIQISAECTAWRPSAEAFVVGFLPSAALCILVCVLDNGPGIPRENWSRIFDPFFTTKEPGQGVGLGLFIVAEVIQEYGGSIAINANPTGGASICIALPAPKELMG